MNKKSSLPSLQATDTSIGFRPLYFQDLIKEPGRLPFLEIMTDDYLTAGGSPLQQLQLLHAHYPLVFHGVSLSLAGADPLDLSYLQRVKRLADEFSALWVSEHLCWTHVDGRYSFDLLPFPFTEKNLQHVASRIHHVQEFLQRQLVVENLSQYIAFKSSEMTEKEFWVQLIKRTGCGMLLDVNNVYVNSQNFGYCPHDFLRAIPRDAVKQYHLAGHRVQNSVCIDAHDTEVETSVYSLYREVWGRAPAPTVLERDDSLPDLSELEKELALVKQCQLPLEMICR